MNKDIERIINQIEADPQNQEYTQRQIAPLFLADPRAKILVVGQAPGRIAEKTRLTWNDRSGDLLREWMGVSRKQFYESGQIGIIPMDFYFPGSGPGGDLPPRAGFAEKWHEPLRKLMPQVEMTLLVGSYACHYYLNLKKSARLAEVVHNYQNYLPEFFPLVHPSPRNRRWLKNNPWFESEVVPTLQRHVAKIID
ncbi:uracil-DNA glycosylase [Ligilactobacillus salitolerans]|uniref:Uracil-DNA glycosylase n=1 Tax=Ligilactobacillus salitolerans TaxID=1808352 RepID=A0A401IVD8_9LACO|nr:uracil-DNA glycosylase family protein [Ligilactobacillus salitolerans]GBG95475.1 uracil-DNA glycosylase [Ligilactobacillus salitolerans]